MNELFELLSEGVTASHTIAKVKACLLKNGFEELMLGEEWQLAHHKKYYVNLYGTNIVAFSIGGASKETSSFRIAMAHSDYPNFQLKPNAVMHTNGIVRLNVEIYGGMYQKSWIDRPLGIAGSVVVKGKDAFHPRTLLYKSDRPLCLIPSLAIHMDRELNKKGALDVAKELVPIAALSADANLFGEIAKALSIQEEEILDYDLYLYNTDMPEVVGLDESMVASPRLDNLTSVAAILANITKTEVPDGAVDVMAIFDNEEVGSLSSQGADSELLPMILEKIGRALEGSDFSLTNVLQSSFLLSVDVAHGQHPNYEEKSDATNKAKLGSGFCLKRSVGQKYGTTAQSAAVVKQLCQANQIPYTIAVNKTGIPGGSTLGPIMTSHLPMPCADIGMPILAMHSTCELGALKDYDALKDVIRLFFAY